MSTADWDETYDGVFKESIRDKNVVKQSWDDLFSQIIWKHFIQLVLWHVGFFASLFIYAFGLYTDPIKWATVAWVFFVATFSIIGETAGAHRLWTHRSYKAKLPLRILLMILYSSMGLTPLYYWIRDHRVHHKFSETDGDPHNALRGFIFAHCGWLAMKRHPEARRNGQEMDMSDVKADPVVMFQTKYDIWLQLLLCYTIPTIIPVIFWEETVLHAVLTQVFIRHVAMLNATWFVNSIAHTWGTRRYNNLINPSDNPFVAVVTVGEGCHNYHHTFPWDYKSSEYPYLWFNGTTLFIDIMAKIGWAYDLKEPSRELIDKVIKHLGYKTGMKAALN